jgi:hypothetical protein
VSEERRIIFGALRKKNENVREKKKRASKEGKKTCQNIVSSRNPIPNRFKYDVPWGESVLSGNKKVVKRNFVQASRAKKEEKQLGATERTPKLHVPLSPFVGFRVKITTLNRAS